MLAPVDAAGDRCGPQIRSWSGQIAGESLAQALQYPAHAGPPLSYAVSTSGEGMGHDVRELVNEIDAQAGHDVGRNLRDVGLICCWQQHLVHA